MDKSVAKKIFARALHYSSEHQLAKRRLVHHLPRKRLRYHHFLLIMLLLLGSKFKVSEKFEIAYGCDSKN